MRRSVPLMRAIMGEAGQEGGAERMLEAALLKEVDPLVQAATELGIGIDVALARGAAWLGLAFYDAIPAGNDIEMPTRLEHLGEIQMVRARALDRDVAYMAPDFFGLLRLAQMCAANPQMQRRICIVPMAAMRTYLARAASPMLIDFARQNLFKHWPTAAAHLELN